MKIFICCSKYIYDRVLPIKQELESQGHVITLPNSFDAPMKEEEMKREGKEEHIEWKRNMMKKQEPKVRENEAILVLNLEKHGQQNYIGGATFLEIFKAFELEKKIFLYNPIPENIFQDELIAINPTVINGDLSFVV
ncbi:hypothetical protein HOD38_03325 [archaeon]|jgi:hypothetical protein|nr:hypothetical protein [archaeon]MBT4397271.1 hypothetical protein [archaeon]MBT4440651.1 hypothetical protein [archaeon]